jgi:TonB family protein
MNIPGIRLIVPLLCGLLLLAVPSYGKEPEKAKPSPIPKTAKEFAISAPVPDYPYYARRRNITGRGVVVFIIDPKSGIVTRAYMEVSTGSQILDDAALSAFRRWRFKPGTATTLRSPISFTRLPDQFKKRLDGETLDGR